jgi:hypothetical protein
LQYILEKQNVKENLAEVAQDRVKRWVPDAAVIETWISDA